MITKTRTSRSITTSQHEADLTSLRRLLTAAAIDSAFCTLLLQNPMQAVMDGFGGEDFILTEASLKAIATLRAKSLPEFINLLDEKIQIL